jgi:hypothetical protein
LSRTDGVEQEKNHLHTVNLMMRGRRGARSKGGSASSAPVNANLEAEGQEEGEHQQVADDSPTSSAIPVASSSNITLERTNANGIFEFTTGSSTRKAIIFISSTFSDRSQLVKKVVQNGGLLTVKPADADVAIVDESDTATDKMAKVIKKARNACTVTRKWLTDSIARGELVSQYDAYEPNFQRRSPEVEMRLSSMSGPIAKR